MKSFSPIEDGAVSSDGRYIFFDRPGNRVTQEQTDIYWIDSGPSSNRTFRIRPAASARMPYRLSE